MTFDVSFWVFGIRWFHVLSGIMWVGLLWYFNFIHAPAMPKIPPEERAVIVKAIAPAALFWFRWAALSTIVFGILLALMNGYFWQALILGVGDGDRQHSLIGFGMWLGTIMAFNVWFIILPNQQKSLGMVVVDAADKPKAARTAFLASRTNTMLSIPMLFAMVAAQNMPF